MPALWGLGMLEAGQLHPCSGFLELLLLPWSSWAEFKQFGLPSVTGEKGWCAWESVTFFLLFSKSFQGHFAESTVLCDKICLVPQRNLNSALFPPTLTGHVLSRRNVPSKHL